MVESGGAQVFCTESPYPHRSEIMRVYYHDRRVCSAGGVGIVGAGIGGAAGIVIAAVVAAALCTTVVLCLLGLLLGAIIAAVAALIGACVGGQIAKAVTEDEKPTASGGHAIEVGDLLSIFGNMERRGEDDGANVFWWASSTTFSGKARSGLPQPFSYCEIDDEFATDACPIAPII